MNEHIHCQRVRISVKVSHEVRITVCYFKDRQSPGTYGALTIAIKVSARFSEKPCLKGKR